MTTVHEEIEQKFDVGDTVDLLPLLDQLTWDEGVTLAGEPAEHHLEATYFDTTDLRLAQARVTLRRRTGGPDAGWHLKVPGEDGARVEAQLPLGRAVRTVPAGLRRLVAVRTGQQSLLPVATVTTERTVCRVLAKGGQVLAEIADDRGIGRLTAAAGGYPPPEPLRWREVEVELVEGDRDLLTALTEQLTAAGLRVADSRSKLSRVLGDRVPAALAGAVDADESPAREVLLRHLARQVEKILAGDPLVRLAQEDAVHQMRVATRRLRSALQTFGPLFDRTAIAPVRAELKWLAAELGVARDAEVLLDRLDGVQVPELADDYRRAHDALLLTLDSQRYHDLVATLKALVLGPPLAEEPAGRSRGVLLARVARVYTTLRDEVAAADAAPAGPARDHHLHEARKVAKRARYAAETVAPAFGRDAVAFARSMERVQEHLGEHQDSVVLRARLSALAAQEDSPQAAFDLGRLHALEEVRGARAEERFVLAWKAARAKSLRRWLR